MFRDVFLPMYVFLFGDILVSISLTKKAAFIGLFSRGLEALIYFHQWMSLKYYKQMFSWLENDVQ